MLITAWVAKTTVKSVYLTKAKALNEALQTAFPRLDI